MPNGSRLYRLRQVTALMTACSSFGSWSYRARSRHLRSTASPPTVCAARRRGTAAIPRRARRRNTRRCQLCAADPARVRHHGVPRPRTCRHPTARRHTSGAAQAGGSHDPIWDYPLRATHHIGIGFAAGCVQIGLQFLSIRQSLEPRVLRPGHLAVRCSPYRPDPRFAHSRGRRCCWCFSWRRSSPASCAR